MYEQPSNEIISAYAQHAIGCPCKNCLSIRKNLIGEDSVCSEIVSAYVQPAHDIIFVNYPKKPFQNVIFDHK